MKSNDRTWLPVSLPSEKSTSLGSAGVVPSIMMRTVSGAGVDGLCPTANEFADRLTITQLGWVPPWVKLTAPWPTLTKVVELVVKNATSEARNLTLVGEQVPMVAAAAAGSAAAAVASRPAAMSALRYVQNISPSVLDTRPECEGRAVPKLNCTRQRDPANVRSLTRESSTL